MSTSQGGSNVDLWIGDDVLTVKVDRASNNFPAVPEQCAKLAWIIQDMARAAKAVIHHAENDSGDTTFNYGPLDGLLDGILLLTQLSEGIRAEVAGGGAK